MTREKMAAQSIVDQYGSALFELSLRLDEVAPQPLYRWVLRRLRPNK